MAAWAVPAPPGTALLTYSSMVVPPHTHSRSGPIRLMLYSREDLILQPIHARSRLPPCFLPTDGSAPGGQDR
jgi:hypothetical protein